MLAIEQKSQTAQTQKPTLTVVEKAPVKTGSQCLAEIRNKLNSKARNPRARAHSC